MLNSEFIPYSFGKFVMRLEQFQNEDLSDDPDSKGGFDRKPAGGPGIAVYYVVSPSFHLGGYYSFTKGKAELELPDEGYDIYSSLDWWIGAAFHDGDEYEVLSHSFGVAGKLGPEHQSQKLAGVWNQSGCVHNDAERYHASTARDESHFWYSWRQRNCICAHLGSHCVSPTGV